ncbi:MAG: Ser/Thr protein phosphatase family protein [Labilithrix sp.]|nr:Ser/Thr protein phosphatase family protein [Labilithrix sp.]
MTAGGRTLAGLGALVLALAGASLAPVACGSSGDASDAGPGTSFVYRGAGCAYDVSPPAALGFVDLAEDDVSPGAEPLRIRLGLGGATVHGAPGYADPSRTAVLTWETATPSRAARVRIAPVGAPALELRGYSWTTPAPENGFGSTEPATPMHEVHVCGLEPGRTYSYQVGGGTPEVWSAPQTFTTVPATGKITVGILGDARDRVDVWQRAEQRMRDRAVNLQITTGDLVFTGTQQSLYDRWLGAIWKDPADPARFVTLGQQMILFVAGNHENDAVRFYGSFASPGTGPFAESYGSFDAGNTHFVVYDDQPLALLAGTPQAVEIQRFLEDDLAEADRHRDVTPFVVVVHHRGLYTTSTHATDSDVLDLRSRMAPLYDRHHVDLVVNGHDHAYERTRTLNAGSDPRGLPAVVPAGKGTVYVVNAGAGADPYAVGEGPFVERAAVFGPGTPYDGLYGVLTLEGRRLVLDTHGLTAAGDDPVIDSVVLER